jgi:FMN phosphatase YigB (HAD superfamily)
MRTSGGQPLLEERLDMTGEADLVFLFDCDNTLLDNDRVHDDLDAQLRSTLGGEAATSYWSMFEQLRAELGYADYLGAVQKLRLTLQQDPRVLELSGFLLDYPFADRLYPDALEAVKHCATWGPTVILSDGDAVFQPRKLERSGIRAAVQGRVLIYVHKERMLEEMMRRYPARRYVMVDDKLRLLAAMKSAMNDELFTVFPRQGHYAHDAAAIRDLPPADLGIEHIGELVSHDFARLTAAPR